MSDCHCLPCTEDPSAGCVLNKHTVMSSISKRLAWKKNSGENEI